MKDYNQVPHSGILPVRTGEAGFPESAQARVAAEMAAQRAANQTRPSVPKTLSEVDAALSEHSNMLDDLSNLAVELKSTFGPVLKPLQEPSCGAQIGSGPVASPLADRINGQNDLLRSILTDLRSIRDRSAV